ncbi:hypothetical protein BDF21DRAFT_394579 [Thamnidium elegans]|uniref:Uncharacterized protein n=1 Tax=Thamnidium elegans TaxID=101142 RepID=A0A8H7SVP2_9FUNG|nr:hypothetical protein INT48_004954 [Thamnidium elegans]KAI8094107.1 hypothetical protein BDF21DRAFT_394579 [Thamnidium elegans]
MLTTLKQAARFRRPATYLLSRGLVTQRVLIRPTQRVSIAMLLPQQQRNMSFRRQLLQSPIGRGLAIATVGGTSILALMVLGPFLLVGIGGLTAIVAFRAWRFKKQLERTTGTDWPEFITNFIQQQQVFGKEKQMVETEAIRRLEVWAQTEQGRCILIEHGIHPEQVVERVLMRASFVKTSSSNNEIKVELDLVNSPNSVLVATAKVDVEGNVSLTDIKLVTFAGQVLQVPLQQNGGGRVIEGEFQDVQ